MMGFGSNANRGNPALPLEVPALLQCLPLEPITLSNQKYTRSIELRRVLGVPIGSTPEENSPGISNPKAQPPVATEELKHFKESVQDASRKARDRAKLFRDSLYKLEKYKEAIGSKKRQRSELSLNEKSNGANMAKAGSQIQRSSQDATSPRLEDRAKSVGLNKRARTDFRAEVRSSAVPRQQIVTDKDSDVQHDLGGGTFPFEEKIRRLPAGGEGWDLKNKKKRSVGMVGSRTVNADRDLKRPMHPKNSSEMKLKSCDVQGLRFKSSPGVGRVNKSEDFLEPTTSDTTSSVLKRELEHVTSPIDQVVLSEQRSVRKGSIKLNVPEDTLATSSSTMVKAKASRGPRTGSIMLLDSSLKVSLPSKSIQGSEQPTSSNKASTQCAGNDHKRQVSAASPSHSMAQWVGQRPHKNARMRRANMVAPISNNDETHVSSPSLPAPELSSRASFLGANGSLVASTVDDTTLRFKQELESAASPFGLSESEESGAGDNKQKHRGTGNVDVALTATQKVGSLPLLVRKNKLSNEIPDGVRRQGRTGRASSLGRLVIHSEREKLENLPHAKPVQNVKSASERNKSKTGRPPSKKLKDRKSSSRLGPATNCGSEDLTGESDDDHEELIMAAKAAQNAKSHACSGPFWEKMESIFASVSPEDSSYLKQQLGFAEELEKKCLQMLGIECNIAVDHSNQESVKTASLFGRLDVGSLDKGASLYQRVLSAIIEEDDGKEFYIHSEGRNMSLHYASDDSHCGSCNLIEIDPKDKDRMESEVESNVNIQSTKISFVDRFSCDKSVSSNSVKNSSMSSSLNSNGYWVGDDDFSHSDLCHTGEICSNDLSQLQMREPNVPGLCSDNQYHFMSLDDRLMMELQSIGLCPETLPDVAEGDVINQDIVELKGGLYEQIGKKKRKLEKLDKALNVAEDVERREIEQVAMHQLIEIAYRKRLACRGNHTSKTTVRKVSRQVALGFIKRTLGRCRKLEGTGSNCFSEPSLQELLFVTPSCNNDAKSADAVGSGTASNTCNEVSNHRVEARGPGTTFSTYERYNGHDDNLDGVTKREVLIDDVIGSASSRVTSTPENNVLGGVRVRRSDRDGDQDKDYLRHSSISGVDHPTFDDCRSDSKTKPKHKQKTNDFSTSENGTLEPSNAAANANIQRDQDISPLTQSNILQNGFKEADEPIDMQMPDFDSFGLEPNGQHELDFFSNIDDDGHDIIGLEIPMDDLSDVHIVF